ncbi:uncharacterized protein [Musca autumnalis]|uniref:uncharacterized protein n=1 Tax=Musca autumnalis TaxID=221902 RepID=UPI003CE7D11A
MLLAGQTAYTTLHNNSNTTNNNGSSAITASTRKQTAGNVSSASANHPPLNKQNNLSSSTNTSSTSSSCPKTNNINSLKNHNSFHFQSPTTTHKNVSSSNDTNTTNNKQQQTHSQKTADNSKPLSFINSLKDTVQKVFVTTATTSFARNCNQSTNTTSATVKTTNSTSSSSVNNINTSKTSITSYSNNNVTSSSSSAAVANTTSSTTTILPLIVGRKKCSSQNLGVQPKLHTIPPTLLHRCPEERKKTSSTDSLRKEMCHFKPIRTVPTTPWKCGSKSRGSSLRFPKADLATRRNEFILKINCDVNNRKKKLNLSKIAQNERKETGSEAGDNGDNSDEQENREYYESFKPKPSTLHLFAEIETPNHHSAFVCLVAHMKNLINIQPTKISSTKVAGCDTVDGGSKNARTTRTKDTQFSSNKRKNIDVPMTEVYVSSNKFKSPALPLAVTKKSELTCGNDVSKKSPTKASEFTGKVTKAKGRRKQFKGAKRNIVPLVKEQSETTTKTPAKDAGHPTAVRKENATKKDNRNSRNSRKRKMSADEVINSKATTTTNANFIVPATPTLRSRASKIAKISVDGRTTRSSKMGNTFENNLSRLGQQQRIGNFSPPLTRSRLKQIMSHGEKKQQIEPLLPIASKVNVRKRKR